MYILNREEKKLFRQIGSYYGCKVEFADRFGVGYWNGNRIEICNRHGSFAKIATIFFHELGHHMNRIEGRYPIYHNPKLFNKLRQQFKTYKQMIRYCLNAEICTEKVGAKLMKQWMPNVKFGVYYKNTAVCYEFLYGFYLGDA